MAQLSGRDADVLVFGLRLLITSITGYLTLIVLGIVLGLLNYVLAAALTASLLRVVSGGAHASSPLRCNLIGAGIFVLLGLLAKVSSRETGALFTAVPIIITLAGSGIIYRFAPAGTPGKPITSTVQRMYLKFASLGLLIVWGVCSVLLVTFAAGEILPVVLASCFGMIWQLISLTPVGYKLVGMMDHLLKRTMTGR